jgi:hypothetical protein
MSSTQEHNGDNCITAKFVQCTPKIFAKPMEIELFLKNLSETEVAALEGWTIRLRERCRQIWFDKRFPRNKEAFFENIRQRKRNQIDQDQNCF